MPLAHMVTYSHSTKMLVFSHVDIVDRCSAKKYDKLMIIKDISCPVFKQNVFSLHCMRCSAETFNTYIILPIKPL